MMMIISPLLLVVVLLVTGLVAAGLCRRQTRKATLVTLGVIAGVVLLTLAGLFIDEWKDRHGQRSRDSVASPAMVAPHPALTATADRAADSLPTSPAWLEADEHFLIADVYPSVEAAARGLGAMANELLDRVQAPAAPDQESPRLVQVGGDVDAPVLQAFADGMSRHMPDDRRLLITSTLPPHPIERADRTAATIRLDIVNRFTHRDAGSFEQRGGELRMTITGAEGRIGHTARYLDKPWVENPAAFLSSTDAPLLIVQSPRPALSADEALDMAYDQAAERLEERMADDRRPGMPNGKQRRAMLSSRLRSGELIRDRFVQRFDRPSGDVYRAALLVSPDYASLDRQIVQVGREQRYGWAGLLGSAALLIATVGGLYGFLNAATRGYYTLSLAVAAVVVGGVGLVILGLLLA
jgi:hypothetical protein